MKKIWFLLCVLFLCSGFLFAEAGSDYPGMKELLKLLRDNEEEAFIGVDFIEAEEGAHTIYSQALILNVYDDSVLFETYYGAFIILPLDKIRFIETEWKNNPEKEFFNAAGQLEKELEKK